jgi:hypothetical protein
MNDVVIATRNKARAIMKEKSFTAAEREYVKIYLESLGKRPPNGKGVVATANVDEILLTDKVKEWVNAERKVQFERDAKTRKR